MLQAILKEILKTGEYENFLHKNDRNIRKKHLMKYKKLIRFDAA